MHNVDVNFLSSAEVVDRLITLEEKEEKECSVPCHHDCTHGVKLFYLAALRKHFEENNAQG